VGLDNAGKSTILNHISGGKFFKNLKKFNAKQKSLKNLLYGINSFYTFDTYSFSIDLKQNVLPTIGFRTVSLKHKSYSVKIYDLGGSSQIRALWPKYYNDVSD